MISVIGLGNGASAIAEKFSHIPQYNVYLMNSKIARNSKYKFKLKAYETPEEYESNVPDVRKFFTALDEKIQKARELNLTHFIDDLPKVIYHPEFPSETKRILFASRSNKVTDEVLVCRTWSDVEEHFSLTNWLEKSF